MPNLPRPSRGDVPPAGDAAYEALLGGGPLPADADEGLRPLAAAIATLTVAPSARELASERDARAVYRGGFGPAARPARAGRRTPRGHRGPHGVRRRNRILASVVSAKLAVVAALTAGALAAAAYAGALPAPVQNFAHHAFGAPTAHPAGNPAPPKTPPGPAPARADARGLCQAYAKGHGNARQKARAFRKLAAAAGGAAQVTAYCAGLAHPAKTPPGQQAKHAAGKPSAASAHTPAAHSTHNPASQPRSHPTHPGHTPGSHPSHPGHHPARRPAGQW